MTASKAVRSASRLSGLLCRKVIFLKSLLFSFVVRLSNVYCLRIHPRIRSSQRFKPPQKIIACEVPIRFAKPAPARRRSLVLAVRSKIRTSIDFAFIPAGNGSVMMSPLLRDENPSSRNRRSIAPFVNLFNLRAV